MIDKSEGANILIFGFETVKHPVLKEINKSESEYMNINPSLIDFPRPYQEFRTSLWHYKMLVFPPVNPVYFLVRQFFPLSKAENYLPFIFATVYIAGRI